MSKQILVVGSVVVSLLMVIIVNTVRMKNTKKPIKSAKNIMIPPLGMATGFSMFIMPMFRPTLGETLSGIAMGLLFSILLIKTSRFEIKDNQIYLQRSKMFLIALIALVAIRMIGKIVLSNTVDIDPGHMSGMFFILAFSMILPWRIGMLIGYKKLEKQLQQAKVASQTAQTAV